MPSSAVAGLQKLREVEPRLTGAFVAGGLAGYDSSHASMFT